MRARGGEEAWARGGEGTSPSPKPAARDLGSKRKRGKFVGPINKGFSYSVIGELVYQIGHD